MLGLAVDAWYVWIGVSIAGLAVLGTAFSLTPTTAPDAERAAGTVDSVAASEPPASGHHPTDADRVRIEPHRIALETDGVRSTATLRFGPVTPAPRGSPLRAVALGASPADAFDSPEAFAEAAEDARDREPSFESATDRLTIRTVEWTGVRVTLVAA